MEHVNAETNIQTSFSPDSISLIVLACNAYLWQSPKCKAREEPVTKAAATAQRGPPALLLNFVRHKGLWKVPRSM